MGNNNRPLESFRISCRDSSLLERPPRMQEVGGSNPGRDMSVMGALVEDGDDLGQVSVFLHKKFSLLQEPGRQKKNPNGYK
jgi:hypothetical protein